MNQRGLIKTMLSFFMILLMHFLYKFGTSSQNLCDTKKAFEIAIG